MNIRWRSPKAHNFSELGAVYLGGHRRFTLARARIVKGTDESLVLADRLLALERLRTQRHVASYSGKGYR